MRTVRLIEISLVALAAWLVGACTKHPDSFCCTSEQSCAEFSGQSITPCTDPARPYCDDLGEYGPRHACIPDPASCRGPSDCTDPVRPFCFDERCVECMDNSTCGAPTASICDPNQHSCRACVADMECASAVCDRDMGACIAESSVIYLSPMGQVSGACTRAAPCNTFALGLAQVNGSRNVIKAAQGTYSGQVSIDAKTVTIFADGAVIVPGALLAAVVVLTNGANATIQGAKIDGSAGAANGIGINCGLGSLLRLRRSQVIGNGGGGVSISGCEYSLINSMIVQNGGSTSTFGGVKIDSIGTAGLHELSFSTVSGNTGLSGANTGVDCSSSVFVPLTFNSSIVYGNTVGGTGAQVGGAMCAWSYSDIGPQTVSGTGNINANPLFTDPSVGNFHLQTGSPARNAADPAATLTIDIDLGPRPCASDDRRDMGADEACP